MENEWESGRLARCHYIGKDLAGKELRSPIDPEFLHSGFESGSLQAENVCRTFFSANNPASGFEDRENVPMV